MRRWLLLVLLSWLAFSVAAWAGDADKIPWDLGALSKPPQTYPAPDFHADGLTAIFYDGLPFHGHPTRVFAWYGVPAAEGQAKVPAMVLVHGGGGTAFQEWVRLWIKRGYAAIAMDTCGCVPKGEYGKWERHEFGGPAGWGGFENVEEPIPDQWTYHAIADVMLAHSFLRSLREVDPGRIGITGISWGGYLTCITAGVDERFKCAIPVYGCGYLGEDSAWLDVFQKLGPEKSRRWLELWDPSVYLVRVRMPMLWITGTNDFAYPMDSLQKSYRLPPGPRQLCLRLRMPHGHGGAGENPEEIRALADSVLRHGAPLTRITGQGREGNGVWVTYAGDTPVTKAELNYTKDTGPWPKRQWESMPATVDAAACKVAATLPEHVTVYYLNVIDNRDLVTSTEHEELTPAPK